MSNRDPDVRYERLDQLLPFAIRQASKLWHTSLPGVVRSYDASTRRARVQPAINQRLTDGSTLPRPELLDVPVWIPAGGGYYVHVPLRPGDPVLLVFGMRSISTWKVACTQVDPDSDAIMSIADAVCVPGWGADAATSPPTEGVSIQTADGSTSLTVEDGAVSITVGGETLRLTTAAISALNALI